MGRRIGKVRVTTAEDIRATALAHPDWNLTQVAAALGCNQGMVSKAVAKFKLRLRKGRNVTASRNAESRDRLPGE